MPLSCVSLCHPLYGGSALLRIGAVAAQAMGRMNTLPLQDCQLPPASATSHSHMLNTDFGLQRAVIIDSPTQRARGTPLMTHWLLLQEQARKRSAQGGDARRVPVMPQDADAACAQAGGGRGAGDLDACLDEGARAMTSGLRIGMPGLSQGRWLTRCNFVPVWSVPNLLVMCRRVQYQGPAAQLARRNVTEDAECAPGACGWMIDVGARIGCTDVVTSRGALVKKCLQSGLSYVGQAAIVVRNGYLVSSQWQKCE